ncbi:TlpA family protein disulfide reductase [Streptomyces albireticuli]|uniref:TlpA family protein disulfide reductase n=1 Tax=Streptomyces albireticuli TaxID=1940 RepID=UPI001E6320CB|nr:MauE/DoxX family redox-associated membrane protein [Streptomyces albireticuli]MCD9146030.1 hypothetical protein [Streptomyces albireticuli]MCD9166249.1 hypothetical protein [Streptomyces albireticuli]MCD9196571.1 hypothetical protein [Streptomyces albireticuli]
MSYALWAIRGCIGTIFFISSLSKTFGRGSFTSFASSLNNLRIIPQRAVVLTAGGVVASEWAVVALLIAPIQWIFTLGLALASMMLVSFSLAIIRVTGREEGTAVTCSCFGSSTRPLGVRQIVRNVLLAGLAILAAALSIATHRSSPSGNVFVSAMLGVIAGVLFVIFDKIQDRIYLIRQVPKNVRGSPSRDRDMGIATPGNILVDAESVALEDPVGEFNGITINGKRVTHQFSDETLVAFFSPSCGLCRRELPRFIERVENDKIHRSRVLVVIIGEIGNLSDEFTERLLPVADVVLESQGGDLSKAFHVESLPAVLRVSPNRAGGANMSIVNAY